jgi:hypothetical protein
MRRGASTRRRRGAALAALVLASGSAAAADLFEFKGFRAEASWMSDDNVNRGPKGDTLHDRILGVRASANGAIPISSRTRATVQAFVGTQRFGTNTGLSNNFYGAQGDFLFRTSGEFAAPTYSAFVRAAKEEYESNLRDGYRSAYGVTVLKPLTDRVVLSAALTYNTTDGRSTVFDTHNVGLRGNFDWSLGRWSTVYLGAEYRRGDSVSSVCRTCDVNRTLGFLASADATIPDDAFTDVVRDAYRLKADTVIATLGYNFAISEKQSLDASWRWVTSSAQNPAPTATKSDLSYTVNQFSLAYLARF